MLSAILVLIGFLAVCAAGWGAMMVMAASMSDDPTSGREIGRQGAVVFVAGVVVFIAVIVAAFVRV